MLRSITIFKALVISFLLVGCESAPTEITGDKALSINTPIYRANKVLYVDKLRADEANARRWADLIEPHEYTNTELAVKNGDPVTIIVNRAYLPTTLTDSSVNARKLDSFRSDKTRDVAVLLDLGLKAGADERFIAVWYQRDVPPDEPLSFQDLTVYSQDSWDSGLPPYFRIRVVDVTNERNTRTEELLNQVGNLSATLSSLFGSPVSGAAVNIAKRAAQLVLANEKNRGLIDFTFQTFGAAQIEEAGGVPLAQFKKGGLIVMGQPAGTDNQFWEQEFQYDYKLRRVQSRGAGTDVSTPFVFATVVTTEAIIPNVVKRRSEQITRVLTSREEVRSGLSEAIQGSENLYWSLQLLQLRENFRKFPTKTSFETLLGSAASNWTKVPKPEQDWLLSAIRTTAAVNLATLAEYTAWLTRCGRMVPFDKERRKFDPVGVVDGSGLKCD